MAPRPPARPAGLSLLPHTDPDLRSAAAVWPVLTRASFDARDCLYSTTAAAQARSGLICTAGAISGGHACAGKPLLLAAVLVMAPLGAQGRRPRGVVGEGVLPPGGRGGRGDHRRLRAGDRQAGRARPASHRMRSFDKAQAALEAGQPPDFLFGTTDDILGRQWAYEDRLVDLEGDSQPGPATCSMPTPSRYATLAQRQHGPARPLRAADGLGVPTTSMSGTASWSSAGFTLADIPKEWEAFWSFWCDQVQPAVRKATGPRRHLGRRPAHVGRGVRHRRSNSSSSSSRTRRHWLDRDRRLQVDDPEIRRGHDQGAWTPTPRSGARAARRPNSTSWTNTDNNKAFLAQTVVMTPNTTLSIPTALRTARPDDYYKNAATIDWPDGADGQPLVIDGALDARRGLQGRRQFCAGQGLRALPGRGRLARPLAQLRRRPHAAADARSCVEQPFWLDPSDPHRMRAAIQILTRPHRLQLSECATANGDRLPICEENVWGKAVHRVAAEGISPEQAVDEAIAIRSSPISRGAAVRRVAGIKGGCIAVRELIEAHCLPHWMGDCCVALVSAALAARARKRKGHWQR